MDTTTAEGQHLLALIMFGPPAFGFGGMFVVTIVDSAKRLWNGQRYIALAGYSRLRQIQTLLLVLALFLFAIALLEPSARDDWSHATQFGWQLLGIGFPYWGINLWFFYSPAVLIWLHFAKLPGLQIIPFIVQCGCALVAMNASTFDPRYPGFAHWVVAQWMLAAVYAVPAGLALRSVPQSYSVEEHPAPLLPFPSPFKEPTA